MLPLIIILSSLLSANAVEDNSQSISYITLDGLLHNDIAINGSIKQYQDMAAWAKYHNQINETGWAQLEIHSNRDMNDSIQAYYSGLIEGYLTWELIQMQWNNMAEHYCDNATEYCDKLFTFMEKNIESTKSKIEKYGKTDPYWHQIELSLIQLTGLEDGYKAMKQHITPLGPRIDLNPKGLLFINIMTETGELEQVLELEQPNSDLSDGRCSAIVKVLPDGSDLFVAHNTWTFYGTMIRIMKKYDFDYENIAGTSISFSSYPGVIYSIDDYYQISSGLVVLETSIGNYNSSLWQYVVADKIVFEFLRNTVANRMARNGNEWTQIFSRYNSGTYNNQFMIVDYNKFSPGTKPSELRKDLLWVLEQMPGFIESADVTQVLRDQGYWPSYNLPYFQFIYNISDHYTLYKKYGDFFDYNKTARAQIFRRDHIKVSNISSLYDLMRYNDYKNDPLSRCNCTPPYTAEYAIASRSDLNDPNGHYAFSALGFRPHGAIDVKLTNAELFSNLEMVANSGPTYENQPPFQWSTTKLVGVRHEGQPDKWNFPAVRVKWFPFETILFR